MTETGGVRAPPDFLTTTPYREGIVADRSLKECKSCGNNRPLADFYLQKRKQRLSDGSEKVYEFPASPCKQCKNKKSRARYERLRTTTECRIDGCKNGVHTIKQGLCSTHIVRKHRYGSPHELSERGKKRGNGHIDAKGYVRIGVKVDGKWRSVPQHRIIMEQHIGRPLRKDENVHHINGVKHDNRVGNLQLWVRSQPSGQRVRDKLAWAEQLIERYGPERDRL